MKRNLALLVLISSVMLGAKAQNFKTTTINGKVWMAENLNLVMPGSWEYNYDHELGRKYGRLYTWDAAKNACPSGWHLPTEQEWDQMVDYVGGEDKAGKQLKPGSKFGFNALLGGLTDVGNFRLMGFYGTFWSASGYDQEHAWYYFMTTSDIITKTYFRKVYVFSVRCVRNN